MESFSIYWIGQRFVRFIEAMGYHFRKYIIGGCSNELATIVVPRNISEHYACNPGIIDWAVMDELAHWRMTRAYHRDTQ